MDANYREKGIFSELTTSMQDLGMKMTYPAACGRNALTAVTALRILDIHGAKNTKNQPPEMFCFIIL